MEEKKETRVGHGVTSFLEKELTAYIVLHTVNGIYQGDVNYLIACDNLIRYNRNEQPTPSSQ